MNANIALCLVYFDQCVDRNVMFMKYCFYVIRKQKFCDIKL